jgi:hypothetical protein
LIKLDINQQFIVPQFDNKLPLMQEIQTNSRPRFMIKSTSPPCSAIDESLKLIKRLSSANAYDHPIESVEIVETHISWILLTGKYAYKIKKPVDFGFLDFSTLDKRRFYCDEEFRLNRRFAPQLYLDALAITAPRWATIKSLGGTR